jgi:hypothetical protein
MPRAAVAARLPSFTLSATYGGAATSFADMFASGNPFWALVGGVSAPIFHAGTLLHQSHAAKAAAQAAQAQYRATALQAFADVSDALTALKTDADALEAATRGERPRRKACCSAAASMNWARWDRISCRWWRPGRRPARPGCRPAPRGSATRLRCIRRWAGGGSAAPNPP